MHPKIKPFDIDISGENQKLWFDLVGFDLPDRPFDEYHQYGSWVMGNDVGGFYSVYSLAFKVCWACHWHGEPPLEELNQFVQSLIDKHFPGTGGNTAVKTWIYLSYLPVETWDGCQLPENIQIDFDSDYYANGTEIRITLPDPELRTDIDDYWVCSDVEEYLKTTPINQPEPHFLKHLAFIESINEDWYFEEASK